LSGDVSCVTLAGLGQEIWEKLESKEFIEEMRTEWEQ